MTSFCFLSKWYSLSMAVANLGFSLSLIISVLPNSVCAPDGSTAYKTTIGSLLLVQSLEASFSASKESLTLVDGPGMAIRGR